MKSWKKGLHFLEFVWDFSFYLNEVTRHRSRRTWHFKGEILRIPDQPGLKIPHMGWNSLKYPNEGRLFRGIPEDSYVYFVHSYYLKAEDESIVTATTEYSTFDPCICRKWKCICLPVPSGKEQ